MALVAASVFVLSGCGAVSGSADLSGSGLVVTPAVTSIDTNCTGCNGVDNRGGTVLRLAARLTNGTPATVTWSVAGGDSATGAGKVSAAGEYAPPGYLTADRAQVLITARLASNPSVAGFARITVTPGFLQPLTPENVALGGNGSVTLTGRLAQAGGHAAIQFALANSANGTSGGAGTLSTPVCDHAQGEFTTCTVTYTAPPTIGTTNATYIVATSGGSKTETEILLNTAGVNSNPALHQTGLATLMPLGSSGGNNSDFDAHGNTITDCCSGTLGALIQDNSGKQYVLSNNHVLARSDHATIGDRIVQPGLIDNNCTPNGEGAGTVPVATLSAWLPLKSSQTNADAAIAQVSSRTLDNAGSILELGAKLPDGSLASAPPGISSTGGKGESAALAMQVAKSGRTTGLTCGNLSAIALDVSVDYYRDCAETKPYLTKTFTNQVAISGDRFSNAGDSGALVVDTANAEPVGLFFAGGTDTIGVGHGVANPATDVLNELGTAAGNATSYTFVGGADHQVSCLNYGDSTISATQNLSLNDAEITRGEQALFAARALVNPASGILGVALGKSADHPGEAAVLVYVNERTNASAPATVEGVRTVVIPTTIEAVSFGTAPLANSSAAASLPSSALSHAVEVKQQRARALMRQNAAFFGVGVGQSLDNPREPALVIYVDRHRMPAHLPVTIDGLRTRYVVMDRLHVTRSYAVTNASTPHCLRQDAPRVDGFDPAAPLPLKPF